MSAWYVLSTGMSSGCRTQLLDKYVFLLGASDTYPVKSTGGSATHHLTQSEIPNYILMYNMMHSTGADIGGWGAPIRQNDSGYIATEYQLETKGGNQPMNILNPYYAVNIWRRIK